MIGTIFEIATGRVRMVLQVLGADEMNANRADGHDWTPGQADPATDWVNDGAIEPRPTIAIPETHTIPANTDWPLDVPVGTAVLIDGDEAGVSNGDLILTFPEAGVWQVELRPPFPFLEARCEVTVT